MESKNIQGIQRRIKEIAKDYESKGYIVTLEPNNSSLPDFLKGFNVDLLATSNDDNVVVEVKSSDSNMNYDQLEKLANIVKGKNNWRFELVFTNPKNQTYNDKLTVINAEDIHIRINEIQNLIKYNSVDSAFLLGWATLEASMRLKLDSLSKDDLLQKPSLYLLKSLFSYGVINQIQLKKLEILNENRNQIIHGFESEISTADIFEIINFINLFTKKGNYSDLYDWLSAQDLDNYEEVYCLYRSIAEVDEYGLFSAYKKGDSIFVRSDLMFDESEELELKNDNQVKEILKLIEDNYMEGMDAEGYYGFHRAMEKDD